MPLSLDEEGVHENALWTIVISMSDLFRTLVRQTTKDGDALGSASVRQRTFWVF